MNVFLRKTTFGYGKRPDRPAKPVDTIAVLRTAKCPIHTQKLWGQIAVGGTFPPVSAYQKSGEATFLS